MFSQSTRFLQAERVAVTLVRCSLENLTLLRAAAQGLLPVYRDPVNDSAIDWLYELQLETK